jgi:hypothetical protein
MDEVLACGQDQFENISNIGKIYFILNVAFVNEHEIVKIYFTFIYKIIMLSFR